MSDDERKIIEKPKDSSKDYERKEEGSYVPLKEKLNRPEPWPEAPAEDKEDK